MQQALFSAFFAFLISLSSYAFSEETIAWVVRVSGTVEVDSNGSIRELKRRDKIVTGDIITTGTNSNLTLKFIDDSVADIDSDSEFLIDKFSMDESDSSNSVAAFKLLKGGLRTLSGKINKDQYQLETPAASIGIRGTQFEVVVTSEIETFASIYDGAIRVNRLGGLPSEEYILSSSDALKHVSISLAQKPLPLSVSPVKTLGPMDEAIIQEIQNFVPDSPKVISTPPAIAIKPESEPVDPLLEMKNLFKTNNFNQVYNVGQALLSDWEGELIFDFMYGISALEIGLANEAVFTLERVVNNQPENLRARADLGRGYFLTQDFNRAKQEFQIVLDSAPPEPVRKNIQRYMDAISKAESSFDRKFISNFSLAAGTDNNINSGTNERELDDNFFNIVDVDDGSKPIEDSFGRLSASVGLLTPRSKISGTVFNVNAYTKRYSENPNYSLDLAGVSYSSYHSGPKGSFNTKLNYQYVWFGIEPLQQTAGFSLDKSFKHGKSWSSHYAYQFAYNRNEKDQISNYFTDEFSVGLGFNHGRVNHKLSLLAIQNTYPDPSQSHQENLGTGISYQFNWQVTNRFSQALSAKTLTTKHFDGDPLFGETIDSVSYGVERETTSSSIYSMSSWQWSRITQTVLMLGYSKAESNINIYNNDRTSAELSINFRF